MVASNANGSTSSPQWQYTLDTLNPTASFGNQSPTAGQATFDFTITYSDAGSGKWRSNVDIVGGDGGKISAAGTYPLDGTAAPSQGYANVDTVAASVPVPNVMVMAFYKEGMPRTTRTYTVAQDGGTMTETIVWLNINGKPEITTNRFKRLK